MSLPAAPELCASEVALLLDIDGTLAGFERRPEEVRPTPRLTGLLQRLHHRLDGRLALISGRALSDMDRITEGAVAAASGVHGLEHRHADGRIERAPVHPGLSSARRTFLALAAEHPGLLVEDKGLGLVLHYRTAPDLEALAEITAARVAEETGLALQRGDMMTEVRTPGRTKGDALRSFMRDPPFQGFRPVYVGDDLTDEWAFRAACDLDGFGVLVGPGRATAASYRLNDVSAVLAWLEAFAAAPADWAVNG